MQVTVLHSEVLVKGPTLRSVLGLRPVNPIREGVLEGACSAGEAYTNGGQARAPQTLHHYLGIRQ